MTEEKKKAIENLEKYIEDDDIYNGTRDNLSDFDKFCINHCTDIVIVLDKIKKQQSELEKKDKIIKWIKDYAQQEVDFRTEDIKDYINDDKEKNKNIIEELKEEREHWKDIIRIINNEKTYMEF